MHLLFVFLTSSNVPLFSLAVDTFSATLTASITTKVIASLHIGLLESRYPLCS